MTKFEKQVQYIMGMVGNGELDITMATAQTLDAHNVALSDATPAIYELQTQYDSRDSFYGKAHVLTLSDGTKQLRSYETIVAEIRNGELSTFGYYSNTTLRHIKDFMYQHGFEVVPKKEIIALYDVTEKEVLS